MTCAEVQGLLPRVAERDGTPRVALETARHLAGCPACAEELLRLREINGLLDALPRREVPASFARRVLTKALPTRAGLMFAALVLGSAALVLSRWRLTLAASSVLPPYAGASDPLASSLVHLLASAFRVLAGFLSVTAPWTMPAFSLSALPEATTHGAFMAVLGLSAFAMATAVILVRVLRYPRVRPLPPPTQTM